MGSATVSVALASVSLARLDKASVDALLGGTPSRAGETPALPVWLRVAACLGCLAPMRDYPLARKALSMIGAVVLAAGRSRRMGTQKLLLPWRGKALIAHVVDAVQASPVAPVCVVTGADGSAVAKALAGRQVQFVGNPDGEGDMLSSVRCGLRALPAACVAALVVLGDQPTITAEAITALLAAARASACGIVVPVCAGRRGHPLCIARRHWAEILSGFQGVGLRGLLAGQAADVLEVPMRDARGFGDVDRPEDYRRLTGGAGTTSDEAAANVSLIDETTGCTTERR